jgi:hypothetical protein
MQVEVSRRKVMQILREVFSIYNFRQLVSSRCNDSLLSLYIKKPITKGAVLRCLLFPSDPLIFSQVRKVTHLNYFDPHLLSAIFSADFPIT